MIWIAKVQEGFIAYVLLLHLTELFPISPKLPQGFSYFENFLSEEEEKQLLAFIKTIELRPMIFQGFEAKRKVASFGYDYSFDTRKHTLGRPIPGGFNWLMTRIADHISIPVNYIAEILVTEYPVGAVINWHRDAPPFGTIVGVSLSSDCVFKLRPYDKAKQTRKATISLPIRRRSFYVMTGPSREDWQHSTAPVTEVRFSITLRTLR